MFRAFPSHGRTLNDADTKRMTAYRTVFTKSNIGREVLRDILCELGYGDIVFETEAERARADYGKRLLLLCGILLPENVENSIDVLLDMPVQFKEEEKK